MLDSYRDIPEKIHEVRMWNSLNQEQMAEILGITQSHMSALERPESKVLPTISVINKLPRVNNVKPELVYAFPNNTMSWEEFRDWIVEQRAKLGYSQADYSTHKGLPRGTIARFERYNIQNVRTLYQVAKEHGGAVTLDIGIRFL